MKKWEFPYEVDNKYNKKIAYFSMEFGIDQALKTYSGGLGFLAGSHLKSAYSLKQNLIGIGLLWKYGYYDQEKDEKGYHKVTYREKNYHFLEDTGITVSVIINGTAVKAKAWYLPPDLFKTAPLFLLSTDVDENDHLAKTITHRLYDENPETRVAQKVLLGNGGARLVEALGGADIYHMNEAHPLALAFHLFEKTGTLAGLKEKLVLTTHTPEKAGNEETPFDLLYRFGYFGGLGKEEANKLSGISNGMLNHTATALKLVKKANGVSHLHSRVAREMWKDIDGIPEIIGITNAQNKKFWADKKLNRAFLEKDLEGMLNRKMEMKKALFEEVADQNGKIFDPNVLTIVWARRFASYKRARLLIRDMRKFIQLLNDPDRPLQIIWAGKPYPRDFEAINVFNSLVYLSKKEKNVSVLFGYEIRLSSILKKGADIWLNTPRRPREASGTSGMTAGKNGAVNLSVADGWIPEFARDGENSFILPPADETLSINDQDSFDAQNLYRILEEKVIPIYYGNKNKWSEIMWNGMNDVSPQFDSDRMADEYYQKLY